MACVEWESRDDAGQWRRHISPEMDEPDAEGLARVMRAVDARNVEVVAVDGDADDPADPIARVPVPLSTEPHDCTCPSTLAVCGRPVCPRRAILPAGTNDRQVPAHVA